MKKQFRIIDIGKGIIKITSKNLHKVQSFEEKPDPIPIATKWGEIEGNIALQNDLKIALNAKNPIVQHLKYNNTDKTIWNNGKGDNTNTSFGALALKENAIGTHTAAFGNGALVDLIDSLMTIAFGSYAGMHPANKLNYLPQDPLNPFIGGDPTYGSQKLKAYQSVFLGAYTSPNADEQTNQIVIGCLATGNGSNTATIGNDEIEKTFLKGKVIADYSIKIGDDSDSATLGNVGSIRYRKSGNNTYCEMSMQTSSTTFDWITIIQNNW